MSSRVKRPWRDVYFHKEVLPVVLAGMRKVGFHHINDLKDAKQYVSSMFLVKPLVDPRTGEARGIIFRTNWLTDQEYDTFISQVKDFAACELGVFVDEQDDRQGINLEDDPNFYLESPSY